MAWTNEQLEAINKEGQNIIVSAGAGSGKTAVLTSRILRKLKMGVSITELLVLTFTKAAASEMKERVREELLKDEELKEQLVLLDEAFITTFDAFSLNFVKKNYYRLNISQDIKIGDSLVIKEVKRKIIDEIFQELYEGDNPDFYLFLKHFTQKDDLLLARLVLNFSYILDLKSDTLEYIQNYERNFFSEESMTKLVTLFEENVFLMLENLINDFQELLSFLEEGKLSEFLRSAIDNLEKSKSYEEIYSFFEEFKMPSLPKGSEDEVKDLKKMVTENIKKFQGTYLHYATKEAMKLDVLKSKETVLLILKINKLLYERIMQYKIKNNYFEFIDVAKMAISLVKNNLEVRQEARDSFNEILIDEYQDTSDLQEEFMSYIAKDNLYMVGDIKQSIYRFRNANPYIFKKKYDDYSNHVGGYKIDLTKNFRSRKEVLNNINDIFNILMTDQFGAADYQKTHQMCYGMEKYDQLCFENDYNLELLNYSGKNFEDFSKPEIEAFIMARDIKDKMKYYQVFDKKSQKIRDAKLEDFCILIDKTTHFETIKKIFEFEGIALNINADSDLSNSYLSNIIANILMLVTLHHEKNFNKEYYHFFTSVARSYLFNYTDTEIFLMVKERNFENELSKKITKMSYLIDSMSNISLFSEIIINFEIVERLPRIGNVLSSLVQVEYLQNILENLNDLGYTFAQSARHIKSILQSDEKIKYSLDSSKEQGVKIMSIHKSKGLEFPICYFPMNYTKFNLMEYNSDFGLDSQNGMYAAIYEDGIRQTILKQLIVDNAINEEISEHIRLFYVALTRAREKMIIVNPIMELSMKYQLPQNFRSFSHFLFKVSSVLRNKKIIDLEQLNMSKDYLNAIKVNDLNINNNRNYESNKRIFSYNTRKKLSKAVDELLNPEDQKNIQLGLKMHSILESFNFKKEGIEILNCQKWIKDLLYQMLELDIFKNISLSNIYVEHEFMVTIENKKYHGIIDLMAVYDDHVDIIDYKLLAIDSEEYVNQLGIYKEYVQTKTSLPVSTYLLSLMEMKVKKID